MEQKSNEMPGREFQDVLDRLKGALDVKTNKDVAAELGLTASNLGERKNRGVLPTELIDRLCERRGLSRDWVYSGQGEQMAQPGQSPVAPTPVKLPRGRFAPPLNARLMVACKDAVETAIAQRHLQLGDDQRARLYAALYEMSLPGPEVNQAALTSLLLILGVDH